VGVEFQLLGDDRRMHFHQKREQIRLVPGAGFCYETAPFNEIENTVKCSPDRIYLREVFVV
jgi:hypothetical protein